MNGDRGSILHFLERTGDKVSKMAIPSLLAALHMSMAQQDHSLAADPARLRTTVEKLASFQTRNTLSTTLNDAVAYVESEFKKIPGLNVEVMEYVAPKGRRVPEPTKVKQVVATLKGKSDRVILVGGHLDSLNLQADPLTGRAPGANDDASGVALVLECARLLAGSERECTIKFVAFTGEEQGLLGATALAQRAKDEGWKLEAVFNNDTVGSSSNKNGQRDENHIRLFSEEATGEAKHESRELARYLEWLVRDRMTDFRVKLVFRRDRFGRGGDHTPFVMQDFNGVRFVEVHEEYTRQHTPEDLPEFMDFDYLAKVSTANAICLDSLARSQAAPTSIRIERDQSHDTTIHWKGFEGVEYVLYWRDTASPVWEKAVEVGTVREYTVKLVNKDDHIFAVGSKGGQPVVAR